MKEIIKKLDVNIEETRNTDEMCKCEKKAYVEALEYARYFYF